MSQPKRANEYEVILLGFTVGSLVAGTLLSRAKHSVLLLKEAGPPSCLTRKGYRFAPFSNFSEKIWRVAFMKRLFHDLHLPIPISSLTEASHEREDSSGEKACFQMVLPTARIDIFRNRCRQKREWRREFSEEFNQIEQFYREMDASASRLRKGKSQDRAEPFFPIHPRFLLNRALRSEAPLDLSSFSKEFQTLMRLLLLAWGNLNPMRVPASLASYLLSLHESGGTMSRIDLCAWKEQVLDEYLRTGGHIEEIESVETISRKWRKGFVILLGAERRVLRSQSLVFGLPLHRTASLSGRGERRLSKLAVKARPGYVLFPTLLGVSDTAIPVGMQDLVLSVEDPEKPYEGGNFLSIAISAKGDRRDAPEGKRALTAQSWISWENLDQFNLESHVGTVMRHLGRLMPFIERHIEFIEADYGRDGISRWSYPHFVYEAPSVFYWREGIIPARISRDLYVTTHESFPYLGLEGEALSGWKVAQQILKRTS